MKNKKNIICLCIIFVALLAISYYVIKKYKPQSIISNNTKVFKDFTFEVTDDLNYKQVDDNMFELRTNTWHANLEPIYDPYNAIFYYPKCTQKFFDTAKYKPQGEIKKYSDPNYYSFELVDGTENNVIVHYKLNEEYVMFISLMNNDNSFSDDGLETILNVLKTVQYSKKGNYDYTQYDPGFYQQCHDIDKYDKDEVVDDLPNP